MQILLFILAIVAGFVLLVKGADYFVEGAAGVAARFGIPQLVIGLTIVAMGTSAPEAAVSITAAFSGSADITIGNVVGSNIMNVLVILGLAAVIIPVAVQESTVKMDIPFMIVTSIAIVVLGLDGTLSLIDGVILWVMFIGYLIYLLNQAKKNKEEPDEEPQRSILVQAIFIVGGIAAIIFGSKLAVYGATGLAKAVGVSDRFIGLTIVALGTSLPELFTSVTAAKRGNADIAIGNIGGSNLFNILFVAGTTALITPVPYAAKFFVDSCVMIGAGVLLFLCCVKDKKLGRIGGAIMLAGYAAYFVYLCVML